MGGGVAPVELKAALDEGIDLGFRQRRAMGVELLPRLDAAELALAGRVVHERDHMDRIGCGEGLGLLDDVVGRHLAAQVRAMLGAQEAGAASGFERGGELAQILADRGGIRVRTDAERIEDGGDAGGGDLRVVGHDGGEAVPADVVARREVAFEVIGVQLDQTRNERVAAHVDARLGRVALAYLGDHAVGNGDPAVADRAVGEDHDGIGKHEAFGIVHAGTIASDGAAPKATTSTTRSATRVRTSSSWKTPTTAAPLRFFSSIRATTRSRFSRSSEAVGSSSSRMG